MKLIAIILWSFLLPNCVNNIKKEKSITKNESYSIIKKLELIDSQKNPNTEELYNTEIAEKIDTNTIGNLNEHLKALAAFYSAMGGTMCSGDFCDLTTALGLGKQGSENHKKLIEKYFPNDKVAEVVLKQDCYLRPSGASTFSDFEFLTIIDKGDTVIVDYSLIVYNRGEIEWTTGPDIYLYNGYDFQKIKRNLWTFAKTD